MEKAFRPELAADAVERKPRDINEDWQPTEKQPLLLGRLSPSFCWEFDVDQSRPQEGS